MYYNFNEVNDFKLLPGELIKMSSQGEELKLLHIDIKGNSCEKFKRKNTSE